MFDYTAKYISDKYPHNVDATPNGSLLVLSSAKCCDQVVSALTATADRLGFGSSAINWVCTGGSDNVLSNEDLREIIEGLDPIAVICTDLSSASLLGEAYECEVAANELSRVFGRSVVALNNFEQMLSCQEDKQIAWKLLRRLKVGV